MTIKYQTSAMVFGGVRCVCVCANGRKDRKKWRKKKREGINQLCAFYTGAKGAPGQLGMATNNSQAIFFDHLLFYILLYQLKFSTHSTTLGSLAKFRSKHLAESRTHDILARFSEGSWPSIQSLQLDASPISIKHPAQSPTKKTWNKYKYAMYYIES